MKVNVSEVVDNSKLGGFQIGLCALCALCLIMDGFDVQSMGYVAPAIVQDWHIPASALGPVFGAAPFGSLLAGMLAHRIGAAYTVIVTGAFCVAGSLWFTMELPKVTAVMRPIYQEMGVLADLGPE